MRVVLLGGGAALGLATLVPGRLGLGTSMAVAHLVPHVLAMGLVPLALVLGAPPALLRSRAVRVLTCRGPAWVHAVEYYGGMGAFVLTGWYGAAMTSSALHWATHAWMLACGLCFWTAVLPGGVIASGGLRERDRWCLVAGGAPVGQLLASGVLAGGGDPVEALVLAAGGAVTALAGAAAMRLPLPAPIPRWAAAP